MAVPGREHIYNFTSAFISLLFIFSFHNKNVLFCVENKQKRIYFQFSGKENNVAVYFYFNFNSKYLKFNLKLTNLCRFDEWELSATIEMLGTNVNVSVFLFKNYVG